MSPPASFGYRLVSLLVCWHDWFASCLCPYLFLCVVCLFVSLLNCFMSLVCVARLFLSLCVMLFVCLWILCGPIKLKLSQTILLEIADFIARWRTIKNEPKNSNKTILSPQNVQIRIPPKFFRKSGPKNVHDHYYLLKSSCCQ